MAGYSTPAWQNDSTTNPISAQNLTAMGQAIELSEHPYGVCSTAAATAAKTVTIDFSGTLTLFQGMSIRVLFTNGNTAETPTLNVNSTGAINIGFANGVTPTSTAIPPNTIVTFTYTGSTGGNTWVITGLVGSYVTAGKKSGTTLGPKATAEGEDTTSSGYMAHAEGTGTVANHKSQHVFGEYNVADDSAASASARGSYVEIVGNGYSETVYDPSIPDDPGHEVTVTSNARTLDWNGNETLAGKLTLGAAPTANMDAATKKYVDDADGDLKSALYDITGATKIENWVSQYRCATNGTSIASPSSSLLYDYTEVTGCVEGDTFNLTGTSDVTAFRLYAWVATDGTIVQTPSENLSYENVTITCPKGATRLFVNVRRSVPYSLYKDCISPQIAVINSSINQINDDLYQYNSLSLIPWTNGTSGTSQDVTYTRNADDSWTINGTTPSDQRSFRNILDYHEALPDSIVPGRKYKTVIPQNSVPYLQVFFYFSDGTSTGITLQREDTFTVPVDAIGIAIRFRVNTSTTVNNQTIKPSIVAVPDWQGEQTIINQTIYNDTYNNDYDITVSPQITTDSNGWLQPIDTDTSDETGKTDMTSAIMAMLTGTGYCHLAPGIFYVSGNIDMPDGSKIEGCGYKTIIRLLASVSSGYAIKMRKYNTVSNLRISGSYSELNASSFSGNTGTRHGLLFTTTGGSRHSTVDNIFITDFTGCGIKCYETSIATGNGLYLSQAKIERCQTGIYIEKGSEFNKFEQVNTRDCYIGGENDGGNNMFIGCTFHATNTGFIIDNSLGDKTNNAHGGVVGCTFCHVGNNEGVAIAVKGSANGFTFSDCQIWYCSVLIDNSYGITFSNIEFGRGVPLNGQRANGATINIDGGGTVMFTGCVFMNDITYPPTINVTNNANVKFTGCYGSHSGNAISA